MYESVRVLDSTPLTQTVDIDWKPLAGSFTRTWMIWFDGGGGEWMQAPKYGTSRNSLRPSFDSSSGTMKPGIRTAWPTKAGLVGALSQTSRSFFSICCA